jgi:hypothetical protein
MKLICGKPGKEKVEHHPDETNLFMLYAKGPPTDLCGCHAGADYPRLAQSGCQQPSDFTRYENSDNILDGY